MKFVNYFWKTLWKLFGTTLKISSAFHPHTDDQSEVVNRSLWNLLRCLVGEKLGNWDLTLPTTEFAYNNLVNHSTGKSPFEVVLDYTPLTPIDLAPFTLDYRASKPNHAFAQHIRDLHAKIQCKIVLGNKSYKLAANACCRSQEFKVVIMSWFVFTLRDSLKSHSRSYLLKPLILSPLSKNWDLIYMCSICPRT